MKIKKKNLKKLINAYINERTQTDQRYNEPGAVASYPDYVDNDNQKKMFTMQKSSDIRKLMNPESEAGLNWPQDFVLFEKQFEDHIANWKLFKREYPKSSFLLQIFDLSGVSSYGDLAKSIEDTASGDAGIYDQFILALNVFSSLPIGMIIGLSGGRLSVKALNSVSSLVKAKEMNGFKIIHQIFKSSDKFRDLVNTGIVKDFLLNTSKIAPEVADKVIVKLIKFLDFLDSFGFRVFMKSWTIITEKFAEEVQMKILEYLASEAGAEFMKSSELCYYLFKTIPQKIGKYLKLKFSIKDGV